MKELTIKPKTPFSLNFKELWQYRELFYFLALRDIKVRYKQTAIGIVWAVLQPFLTMIVFTVFFGKIAGIQINDVPYPVFSIIGLLFWNYFSNSLSSASDSMIANRGIVQKVYFPRIIIPLASTMVFLLDFFCTLGLTLVLMIYFKIQISWLGVVFIVPALIVTFLAFSGLGLAAAAINVKYRDVRYALPFFIQLLIFVSPVIYPVAVLGKYQWLWFLNPMSGVIETGRNLLLGLPVVNWSLLGVSALASIILFLFGVYYFNKTEKWFADVI